MIFQEKEHQSSTCSNSVVQIILDPFIPGDNHCKSLLESAFVATNVYLEFSGQDRKAPKQFQRRMHPKWAQRISLALEVG